MATSFQGASDGGNPVVLVIEDEPVLRLEIVDLLEDDGFAVVEATGVENALHILETRLDIRIVYMDLDMPKGVDGVKIAAAIRDRWPPIEIVLTASRVDGARVKLPVRSRFFAKPINPARVMETVRAFAASN